MAKGRQVTNGTVVASPTEMDVLCSKDKSVAKHPGNLVFRQRIEQVTTRYSSVSSKQEKMKITRDIVTFMQVKHGARFLKQNGSVWMEITDQMARDKTSHALRFAAKNLGVSRPSPNKKRQRIAKKTRKPSISSQSTVSTASSKSDSSTDLSVYAQEEDYTPEPIVTTTQGRPVASIYMRQQSILTNMQQKMAAAAAAAASTTTTVDGYMDFVEFQAKSLSHHNNLPPEFNTIRSEDWNDLLRDPMFDSIGEWEAVGQMAEC